MDSGSLVTVDLLEESYPEPDGYHGSRGEEVEEQHVEVAILELREEISNLLVVVFDVLHVPVLVEESASLRQEDSDGHVFGE